MLLLYKLSMCCRGRVRDYDDGDVMGSNLFTLVSLISISFLGPENRSRLPLLLPAVDVVANPPLIDPPSRI